VIASVPIVIIGMGQLGTLFAGLFETMRAHVLAVRRGDRLPSGDPIHVVVAVGEDDLGAVLSSLPPSWRDRVLLVQNELAPSDWLAHGITRPTVAAVWFEKKGERTPRVVQPTLVAGPWALSIVPLLNAAGLAAKEIPDEELPRALLDKNVYIVTSNIAGLAAPPGTTTSALLELPLLDRTCRVFADVLRIESARLGITVDADDASAVMMRAFRADPDHVAAGRSAPARLRRALARADVLGIDVPALREIRR
jgi:hypothetical protein